MIESVDDLFRNEILEDMEEDTIFDDDNSLVEAVMDNHELDVLDEFSETVLEDSELDDLMDLDDNDIIDDMMDLEDEEHE